MSRAAQKRCVITFRTRAGGTDSREVLIGGNTPQSHWRSASREALYRQHDISGVTITNIRVCTDQSQEELKGAA
jgi:hypothetical protein